MADLSRKKSDCLSELVRLAPVALGVVRDVAELVSYATDNGFLTGGANAIADADCTGENAHLTAAGFNAALTAIGNVNLNASQKTTMRQVERQVIPPRT